MTDSADNRLQARNDLAWAIAVGGIGVVLFAALLTFAWHFAATLFLLFAGMLLGVALNAMTTLLGRLTKLPHALRLAIVCLAMAGLLSGIVFLGGTTIAQQATVLSNTIKSQLGSVKDFLEQHGVDTSYLDFTNAAGEAKGEGTAVTTTTTTPPRRPSPMASPAPVRWPQAAAPSSARR
ncbi:putative PurR-regulated permease PerM [Bradyrhizobium sp. USDA 3256]